jgi:transcriptional regulator with XRE-family HTH domain
MQNQDEAFRLAGDALRTMRQAKGLSQEDLSFEAKMDQSTLSKIERMGPHVASWKKLQQIAECLGCTIEVTFRPKQ